MSISKNILSEEHENLLRQLNRFMDEKKRLPKGSIRMKSIRKKKYPYLQYKENGKVKSKLIKQDDDIDEIIKKIERRKIIEVRIRNIKVEIREIEKALKKLK